MGKYTSQQNHIKDNYTQFKFNIKPETIEEFKKTCKLNNTTATTEIKKFIDTYIEKTANE